MKHRNSSGIAPAILVVSLALGACATEPAATPAAPAAPASTAVAATSVAQPAAQAASAVRPEFPGFILVVRKGEELYCQKRNMTGSRARVVEVCHTREEMRHMAENNDEYFKQAGNTGAYDTLRTDSAN
jgi:hypothetical protein